MNRTSVPIIVIVAVLFQLADVITFAAAVPAAPSVIAAEASPLGALYAIGGTSLIAVAKMAGIGALLGLAYGWSWHPKLAHRAPLTVALAVATVGAFGATANLLAWHAIIRA